MKLLLPLFLLTIGCTDRKCIKTEERVMYFKIGSALVPQPIITCVEYEKVEDKTLRASDAE